MQPKYPNIRVRLAGTDSNAFAILAAVKKALHNNKVSSDEIKQFYDEATSGDYDNLLQTAMKWVEVSWGGPWLFYMPKYKVKWKQYFTKHYEDIVEAPSGDEAAKLVSDNLDTTKGLTFVEHEATVVTRVESHE